MKPTDITRKPIMDTRGDSIRVVHPLFQVEGGGSIPTSPLQLHVGRITVALAVQLNSVWHSRLPQFTSPQGRCVAFGAEYADRWYAVAIWSPPLARMLNYTGRYELRRFAIAPDAPKNTASRVLRIMKKLVPQEIPGTTILISYQDTAVHEGTIYRAAGWKPVRTDRGGEWSRPALGRHNRPAQADTPKIRWELDLSPNVT